MRFQKLSLFIVSFGIALAVFWFGNKPPAPQIISLQNTGFRAAYLIPETGLDPQVHLIITSGEMDNKGTAGIAHYVEHLAWMNSVGATDWQDRDSNAFTTPEQTEYFIASPDPQKAVATLASVLSPLPPDNEMMRSERQVILREYDYRMGENPMAEIMEGSDGALYSDDPRGRSVIGSKADIANFSLDEARAWHQSTHRRENAILVFYGPITQSDAESYIWQAFPDLMSPAAPPMMPRGFVQGPPQTILHPIKDARFGQDFLNYRKTVSLAQDSDYVALIAQLSLLYDILDSTLQGSYAKPLRFSTKTAQSYFFYLSHLTTRDIEFGFIDARPDQGISLDQLQTAIAAAVQTVAQDGIPKDTFDRVKSRWLKGFDTSNPAEESFGLTLESIRLGQAPVSFDDFMQAARAVTADDLNKLVRAMAGQGRVVVDLVSTQKEN